MSCMIRKYARSPVIESVIWDIEYKPVISTLNPKAKPFVPKTT